MVVVVVVVCFFLGGSGGVMFSFEVFFPPLIFGIYNPAILFAHFVVH